jgi:HlyD family secretion protein
MNINIRTIAAALILPALVSSCKKEQKMELETYTVKPITISEVVTATGTMESVTQVDVGTQVTGIIDKLYADYNDTVKKGQLLAEIEKTLLDSELRSADASLASAKSTLDYAKQNYDRDVKLHNEQLISDYEFANTKKEYEVAVAAYEKSKADRVRAAKNLNYAEIYSPIDGIIISREVEVGQTVVSSMNVANLYVIADLDNMQVVGNVDEADIGQVKVGQNVTFTVDAYTNDTFTGTVTQVRLNPTTTSNVVTYEVIVAAPNPEHKLIPGMTANLTIYTTELKDVLGVPLRALKFEPVEFGPDSNMPTVEKASGECQNCVYILRDNKLVQTPVEVGQANSNYQQILSGIKEGDKVAIQYNETVTKTDTQTTTEESPFMPKRPGSNKEKKTESKN